MKIKYFFHLIIYTFIFCSCNDFLTEYPTNNENVPNFYKTEADIEQGVNAAYSALAASGEYGKNFIYLMEVRSDNSSVGSVTNSGGIYGDVYLFRESPYNILLNDTWVACYEGIKRCNIVIDRIDNVKIDEDKKNKFIGEMLFIRALTHFNLVRLWGDVPLVTHYYDAPFEAFKEGRTPSNEVYSQIESDLKEAIKLLPETKDKKRPGAAIAPAAKALLSKVYLTLNKYNEAKTLLSEVINSGVYKFMSDYSEIFDVAKKNNAESVFEIQYSGTDTGLGSAFANIFAPAGSRELTNGVGTTDGGNLPTKEFVKSYEEGDLRKDVTVGTVSDGTMYCKKFVAAPVLANQSDANFIVMRYTDVLLMYAEALNEISYSSTGEAITLLNKVRGRAGLKALDQTDLPDKESFKKAVIKERRYEFAFENHRWFDLTRTNSAIEAIKDSDRKLTISDYQLVYPIPQKQIDVAPGIMIQNPNY